ncbi:MAG: ATP-binding protein [Chloroflexota bacterium]
MLTLNTVTFLFNGLTLSLALGFLILILWYDARRLVNQFFAIFLIFVLVWNVGSFFVQLSLLISNQPLISNIALGILELGFMGSNVSVYIVVTVLAGIQSRRLVLIAYLSISLVTLYRLFLIVIDNTAAFSTESEFAELRFQPLLLMFFLLFSVLSVYVTWRYRRKIRSVGLSTGVLIFVIGQNFTFLNPQLVVASFATSVSAVGVVIMGLSLMRREIINPLRESSSQLEAMHRVSLAVSSQIAIGTVLDEITIQAAGWLDADGAAILLKEAAYNNGLTNKGDMLALVSVYHFPREYLNLRVRVGYGITGIVAQTERSVFVENYTRDWQGENDLPFARETFGSTICVPLKYGGQVIGVLLVVAGKQGIQFQREDVTLLEMLGAQAAVAIAHSHLFAEQRRLTQQVDASRRQLEAVLSGTDNPVIAVDRKLHIVFANTAVRKYFPVYEGKPVWEGIPAALLPQSLISVYRDIKRKGGHVYEVTVEDKIFLCYLATLGRDAVEGWVAVLNDVTELKELDRLKSEMVRMASHDLKNPLMGALAYVDLLKDELSNSTGTEPANLSSLVQTVEWQLERMNRIIRGILDLERFSGRTLQRELCSPVMIVQEAVNELKHLAEDQNISLAVSSFVDDVFFLGDPERFTRAVVNLIENAIKFSPKDSEVKIEVLSKSDKIIFKIIDRGVGIPDDMRERIFDRFFRGNQPGIEHVTGSGLGLSLVKSIVESHDGSTWFESVTHVGTTFYISVGKA